MKRLASVLALFSILMCGCYDNHNAPAATDLSKRANCTIAQLRELCEEEEGCYLVTEERICVGRITSSDSEGNFYRSLIVEDHSGGAEIKLGTYNIASRYPVGLLVALHLNGTALKIENGVVQVGLPPQSFDSSPREMESQLVIDKHIVRSSSVAPTTPATYNISSLDSTLCGRFVRIENICHAPLIENEEVAPTEYYRFANNEDSAIFAYISTYADFAAMEIPTSEVAIQGILYHEAVGMGIGRQFVIKPRFKDDIATTDNTI